MKRHNYLIHWHGHTLQIYSSFSKEGKHFSKVCEIVLLRIICSIPYKNGRYDLIYVNYTLRPVLTIVANPIVNIDWKINLYNNAHNM